MTGNFMLQEMFKHCSTLTIGKIALWGIVLAIAMELFTAYLGILLGCVAWAFPTDWLPIRNICWMIALAFVASDLMHHFLILWPITGSPEFDIVYPRRTS